MKKTRILIFSAAVLVLLLAGCAQSTGDGAPASKNGNGEIQETGKLRVVATLFPQYDFARQIAGDRAEVTLLLPPGVESHSFEPKPSDMVRIKEADLFLYTGEAMEAWAGKIIGSMEDSGSRCVVLDVSRGIDLASADHEDDHGDDDEHGHDHGDGYKDEDGDEHDHGYAYDPHIWTDPLNAKIMVAGIRDALCGIDPANGAYYQANAASYLEALEALDGEFRAAVSAGKRDKILFASRFALYYFTNRYGIEYEAAFDSCSSETEPSARRVADLIEEIREERIPVIYYAELEDPKIARSISGETGVKMLLFHSCHNLTREELEGGATYLSLMKQNVENLKEGLE